MKILFKYKDREWKLPIGKVRTIQSILDEFCPVTLFPSENIEVHVNGKIRRKELSVKDGDEVEIKDIA